MAVDIPTFFAEINAGSFSLADRGLMGGATYKLSRVYNDKVEDPLAHTIAKTNPAQVAALTRNNKLASFDAILGPVWPS